MMMEEGLENRIQRHAKVAAALRAGAEALGLSLLAEEGHRLNPLTTISIPEGIEDAKVRRTLLNEYDIEIGGGLGEFAGKAWRVGLMGESAREKNVFALLGKCRAKEVSDERTCCLMDASRAPGVSTDS